MTQRDAETEAERGQRGVRERDKESGRTLSRAHVPQVDTPAHTVSPLIRASGVQCEVVKRHHITDNHRLRSNLSKLFHATPRQAVSVGELYKRRIGRLV